MSYSYVQLLYFVLESLPNEWSKGRKATFKCDHFWFRDIGSQLEFWFKSY